MTRSHRSQVLTATRHPAEPEQGACATTWPPPLEARPRVLRAYIEGVQPMTTLHNPHPKSARAAIAKLEPGVLAALRQAHRKLWNRRRAALEQDIGAVLPPRAA